MIGYATGSVERVLTGNFNGVGVVLSEEFTTREGELKSTRIVAWFNDDPKVNVGDTITVSGSVSAKVDTWTGNDGQERTTAKLSLNGAKLGPNRANAAPAVTVPDTDDLPF